MLHQPGIAKPTYPAAIIDRQRLYNQLERWRERRAILIHAPTGYGKSSLVSRWIDTAGLGDSTAWLSLDESANEPRRFCYLLAAALERVLPGTLALIRPILQDRKGTTERVLLRLFEAITDRTESHALSGDQHILLVLDDLHLVNSKEIYHALEMTLNQGPENLHLILAARHRTTLALARLYAQEKLVVLNVEDLRFTPQEIDGYLQHQGFLPSSQADIEQLAVRSEGWAAGLHLAVLALHGRRDAGELLGLLHVENTWLADYLVDEVLNQQAAEMRQFLLKTSILDGFNGQLCQAVTGDPASIARLAEMVQLDLFLIQLEGEQGWYRYHHLFQELLRQRLNTEMTAAEIALLHQRAGDWLAEAGQVEPAVGHYLAGNAGGLAVALVERQVSKIFLQDSYQALHLLELLPHDLLASSPQLMLARCRLAAMINNGQVSVYVREAQLTLAEAALSDPDRDRHQAEWLIWQGVSFFLERDITSLAKVVDQAESYLPCLDDFHLGTLRFQQMLLQRAAGRRAEMFRTADQAIAAFRRAGYGGGILALGRELARTSVAAGDSQEANLRFQGLITEWQDNQSHELNEIAYIYIIAAENAYWQDQLTLARAYQQNSLELAHQLQDRILMVLAYWLGETMGSGPFTRTAGDRNLFEYFAKEASPELTSFQVDFRTRALIAAGRSDLAWQVLQDIGWNLESIPCDPRSRQMVAWLRTYIARGSDLAAITPLLSQAISMAREQELRFHQLQLLALQAWQQWKLAGLGGSLDSLSQAVQLARETGYVRLLLDIPELANLLQEMGVSLSAADLSTGGSTLKDLDSNILTDREQRVLELLAADYSYQEIGKEMVISVNTVRTHVKNIYRKLSARRRDQVITKAKALGLLHSDQIAR
jgi:LuxR family maltose regulon positive regulatory protein